MPVISAAWQAVEWRDEVVLVATDAEDVFPATEAWTAVRPAIVQSVRGH